ncbi:leucine-rich repeat-containing protein loc400891-like [Stylonychia lemnae]|uniref:Leucine-rich repeat-containing protein loc400891-like n=1 Tax=Stylonychia lemnae TaxID=5949 RepID=A0A078AC62_STYLE|nr:leucine-rich repeat-containing protein loc400891-like [Stylonychia lemnae]|eukprot:CDW79809.1 leucine-rich repeat-containing protein loc400891-like [Stylonychia lemnae]
MPKAGLVYSEKAALSEILCKPKILPLKSVTLQKLEEMEINNLAKDKKGQYFIIDEDKKALLLSSTKQKAIDLVIEILKLRPDIIRIELLQNLDVDGVQKLFIDFNLNNQITQVCFKRFMWYDQRAEILGQFFMKNKIVKQLEIITVNDCNRGLTPLFEALTHNRSISRYKIAINTIGQESILFLTKIIMDNKNVESLDLSYEICLENIKLKGKHSNIQELMLKGCDIGKSGCKNLGTILEIGVKIQNLDLSWNLLQLDSVIEICKGMKLNSTLLHLDLSNNLIEEKSMKPLSEALRYNSTIRTLNLNNNTIHANGCIQLTQGLIDNISLRSLSLSNNFIKDEGCEALCHYLGKRSCILEHLDISDNFIREKGSVNLLAILDYKESDNPEEDENEHDGLFGIIGKNDSIKVLDMSRNDIKKLEKEFHYIPLHRKYKIKVILNDLR